MLLKPGEAARYLHVGYRALRKYQYAGLVKPAAHTPGGQALYDSRDLDELMGVSKMKGQEDDTRGTAFYVRSSTDDPALLASQEEMLTRAYGKPWKVYKDKASGLNENRTGLSALLRDARKGKINRVCITARDRLARFGYKYLEQLLAYDDVRVVVLDDNLNRKSMQEELLQDFMSLLASFSGKYYKLRSLENKKKLLELAGEELDDAREG